MPTTSLAELPIRQVLEMISSDTIAPGAGAAGAVTLGLAAACAAKAVAISMKHSREAARLAASLSALGKIRSFALQGADADSSAFAEFLQHKDLAAAARLIETGGALVNLADALTTLIGDLELHVSSNMSGDLSAAKALAAAARHIQSSNDAEAKKEQRAMSESARSRRNDP
jgi:hypothetical protein